MLKQPLPMRPGAELPVEWDFAALGWLPSGDTITPTLTTGPHMAVVNSAVVGGKVVALVRLAAVAPLGTETWVDCYVSCTPSGTKDTRRFRFVADLKLVN